MGTSGAYTRGRGQSYMSPLKCKKRFRTGHIPVYAPVQSAPQYTNQNTGFTTIYWSEYRVHHNILSRIQGSPQYIDQNTGFATMYWSEYRVHHNILVRIQGSPQYIGKNTGFTTIY